MCFLETGGGKATALRFDYEHPPVPPQPNRRGEQVRDLIRGSRVVVSPSRTAASGDAESLLLVNLGPTFARPAVPEPLIAPPEDTGWRLAWSSEDPRYGGHGTPPPFDRMRLAIPARAAIILVPDPDATLSPEEHKPPEEPKARVEP